MYNNMLISILCINNTGQVNAIYNYVDDIYHLHGRRCRHKQLRCHLHHCDCLNHRRWRLWRRRQCVHVCMYACIYACIRAYIHACWAWVRAFVCVLTYIHSACVHVWVHACIRACVRALHTYLMTQITVSRTGDDGSVDFLTQPRESGDRLAVEVSRVPTRGVWRCRNHTGGSRGD
jgi:hypothetical protein